MFGCATALKHPLSQAHLDRDDLRVASSSRPPWCRRNASRCGRRAAAAGRECPAPPRRRAAATAPAASSSVNARLSVTACAASVDVAVAAGGERAGVGRACPRWPSSPSSRPSSAPPPSTGWAAPMCVPGAIAAMSAAIVRMKPAEAARAPDGATKIATGVLAAIMRDTMARVESTQPARRPQREHDERPPQRDRRGRSCPIMYSAETGWMMPSTTAE